MDMAVDQITEGLGRACGAPFWAEPLVDAALGVEGPLLGISPSPEGIGGIAALATTLRAPITGG